jgi:hypothetical protein
MAHKVHQKGASQSIEQDQQAGSLQTLAQKVLFLRLNSSAVDFETI